MASLKEIFESAQQTGKVEYTYFGGTNVSPFTSTTIPVYPGTDKKLSSQAPYIRLGYEGGFPGDLKFRTDDPSGVYNAGLAATRDVSRIGAFLTDIPNGPLWLIKQSGLQFSNPDMSVSPVLTDGSSTVNNKSQQLTGPRFYNPVGANTLASVAGNVLGQHFTRHGLSPVNDVGYLSQNKIDGNIESRLEFYALKLINPLSNSPLILNSYKGGPDSFYGIGNTTLTSYADSYGLNTGVTNKRIINQPASPMYNGFRPWGYQDIQSYGAALKDGLLPGNGNSNKYIQDFRQETNQPFFQDYPFLNVHNRIGVTTGRSVIKGSSPNTVDSINILKITPSAYFYSSSNSARSGLSAENIYTKGYDPTTTADKTSGYYGRDIIRFRIEVLNNDNPTYNVVNAAGTVTGQRPNTDVIAFRAYLDSMSDDFNSTWKEFNYAGRGEPFYIYEKFKRTINFSFYMMAHSGEEMASLYTKLNYLMSAMTPDYKNNLMRGNYTYLTIGEYIYRQPGVVTKLSVGDFFKAPWEIALFDPETRASIQNDYRSEDILHYEIPKFLKISMDFQPIHDFLPKRMYNSTKMPNNTATFVTPNHMLYPFSPSKPNKYLPSNDKPEPPIPRGGVGLTAKSSLPQTNPGALPSVYLPGSFGGNLTGGKGLTATPSSPSLTNPGKLPSINPDILPDTQNYSALKGNFQSKFYKPVSRSKPLSRTLETFSGE